MLLRSLVQSLSLVRGSRAPVVCLSLVHLRSVAADRREI
jgi:hypothetical protein